VVVILWCPKVPRDRWRKTDAAKSLSYNSAPWKVCIVVIVIVTCSIYLHKLSFCLLNFSLINITFCLQHKASKSEKHIPIVYPEVILCVEIYEQKHSSMKVICWTLVNMLICNVKYVLIKFCGDLCALQSHEFLVLGSQLLADLKDNIYCSTNTTATRFQSYSIYVFPQFYCSWEKIGV
jgi:hypothetical protein